MVNPINHPQVITNFGGFINHPQMACLWQPGFPTFPLSAANCGGWFDGSSRSELQPCQHCQRSFRPAALDKHVKVPWATLAPSNSFYETQLGCVQKLQNAKVLTPSCPTFTGLLPILPTSSSSCWMLLARCVRVCSLPMMPSAISKTVWSLGFFTR